MPGAPDKPTVYVLSDSLGETAEAVAKAAMSQFAQGTMRLVRVPKISSAPALDDAVNAACGERCVFFYTFADPSLRAEMLRICDVTGVLAIDILGPGIEALSIAAQVEPAWEVGMIRKTDRGYFARIESLEFAVKHDDGRSPDDLERSEIVLIGVSRTSKTPLSMYLAFKGYRVANIPLMPEVEPPATLFKVDSRRVFGLVSNPEHLVEIRGQRLTELGAYARRYADREAVERELESARSLMRRLGATVVRVDDRAIEETAQEILRNLETSFP